MTAWWWIWNSIAGRMLSICGTFPGKRKRSHGVAGLSQEL